MGANMNSSEFNQLLEIQWRRRLTAVEQQRVLAHLAEHPAERERWAEEEGLKRLLGQLPDVPLASNFTAQVLQAVAKAPSRPRSAFLIHGWKWLSPTTWARRTILASGIIGLIVLISHSYQLHTRIQLARSVAEVSRVAALPDIEILKDYDAISRLSQVPPVVDEDLLAALQ